VTTDNATTSAVANRRPVDSAEIPAPNWKRRECRYSGPRWQWVIGSEQVALWHGNLTNPFDKPRTIFNLRIEAAWRALTGKDER